MAQDREQIIKALEHWAKNFDGKVTDLITLCDTVTLIKELQAHNENLKKENKYLRERLAEEAEIKEDMVVVRTARSGGKAAQLNKVIHIKKDEIIADTVKKMQDKLKATFCPDADYFGCDIHSAINEKAKEILNESQ